MIIKPRTKGKVKADLTLKDAYLFYLDSIEEIKGIKGNKTKGSYNINKKKYTDICEEFNENIVDLEIKTNFEYKVPFGVGKLSIKGYKPKYKLKEGTNKLSTKNLFPDWFATKQLWLQDKEAKLAKTIIYHDNKHTNGTRYKFFWSKKKVRIRNISIYQFTPTRNNKRYLAQCLKNKDLNLNYYF